MSGLPCGCFNCGPKCDCDGGCSVVLTNEEWEALCTDERDADEHTILAVAQIVADRVRAAKASAWDERDRARPQHLGPDGGHYPDDCMGWEDCRCASYPNPYRA